MNNIKTFAWGLGITTLASLVTVPAGANYPDKNHDIGISHPVGIYASYEEDESEAESRDAEKKKYMSYRDDIYDTGIDLFDKDIEKHCYDESVDFYKDPYLRAMADRYKNGMHYKLENCKYEAMCFGTGLGFGDYIFTEGFTCYDPDRYNITFAYTVVKATQDEFYSYIDELNKYNRRVVAWDRPETGYLTYMFDDDMGSTYEIEYDIAKQLIYQRRHFYN